MINFKEVLKYNLFFLALCALGMSTYIIGPILALISLLPVLIIANIVLVKRIYGREKAFFTGIIYNLSILITLWLFVLLGKAYEYIKDDPLKNLFPTEAVQWFAGYIGWLEGFYVIIFLVYHLKKRKKE
ncbi:hypothetical protein [Emticicia sp. 17c]|uniref:hypothetical protein n=1 Tax=Emticicia sp. 17c TaxID=3127704 RepID=UPI00301D2812